MPDDETDPTPDENIPSEPSEPSVEAEPTPEPSPPEPAAAPEPEPEPGPDPATEMVSEPATATAVAPEPMPAPDPMASSVAVETAQFPPILEEGPGEGPSDSNLDILLDVPVPISAEIGRTEMPFADVLRLGPGSVIELDKSADEPIDVLVNGKYLATGEVVVVGERFGIRILDVIDKGES